MTVWFQGLGNPVLEAEEIVGGHPGVGNHGLEAEEIVGGQQGVGNPDRAAL